MKTKTINLKGKSYAQVKDRVLEFREANPRGLIETFPTIQDDGNVLFKARILKDKNDPSSAEATGHALGQNKSEKSFEKLETIAVGRALALLGYSSGGEIASSQEMEEFEEERKRKLEEGRMYAIEALDDCKTLDELKTRFTSLGALAGDIEVIKKKDELKKTLK